MTRITVLAGAAAAIVLLGCAMLSAEPRWNEAISPLSSAAQTAFAK